MASDNKHDYVNVLEIVQSIRQTASSQERYYKVSNRLEDVVKNMEALLEAKSHTATVV